jgi:hypothetical protein
MVCGVRLDISANLSGLLICFSGTGARLRPRPEEWPGANSADERLNRVAVAAGRLASFSSRTL